jgi:hypothetical protein
LLCGLHEVGVVGAEGALAEFDRPGQLGPRGGQIPQPAKGLAEVVVTDGEGGVVCLQTFIEREGASQQLGRWSVLASAPQVPACSIEQQADSGEVDREPLGVPSGGQRMADEPLAPRPG